MSDEITARNGIEIGLGESGDVLIRDHVTGEVFRNIVGAELIVDPKDYNGTHALPVLRITCLNQGSAFRRDSSYLPAGAQSLFVTTPVFVEVRQKPLYKRGTLDKEGMKQNRRLHRARKIVDAAKDTGRLRKLEREAKANAEIYANFRTALAELAETHPVLREFVAGLPATEAAQV